MIFELVSEFIYSWHSNKNILKNPTPRVLALLAALFSSSIVLISASLFNWFSFFENIWIHSVSIFIVSFLATFIIFKSLLEIFIYRKIKLIYKTITTEKNSKEKTLEKINLSNDIISNVGKEVIEWEKDRNDEIAQLKQMENFRKEFLGNVSHELKTPLFNIQGYIHTLLEGALDDPEVIDEYQGNGIGSLLIDHLEKIALEKKIKRITLDSRENAVQFYIRNGYKVIEPSYLLFGLIKHFKMQKDL